MQVANRLTSVSPWAVVRGVASYLYLRLQLAGFMISSLLLAVGSIEGLHAARAARAGEPQPTPATTSVSLSEMQVDANQWTAWFADPLMRAIWDATRWAGQVANDVGYATPWLPWELTPLLVLGWLSYPLYRRVIA